MGVDMAIAEPWEGSGFEGFEKRLEIEFFPSYCANSGGLRTLTRSQLDNLLKPAECTIVSELHNNFFDSYVLSESSLFVYPFRIILKTCGRTQLLKSIPLLLHHASNLSLRISRCKYSRGTFIFPQDQPFPYTCFSEEVRYLDEFFGDLGPARCKSCVMGDAPGGQNWHIYSAADEKFDMVSPEGATYTLEMCMTELDSVVASQFFNESGSKSGQQMTTESGIAGLLPNARICDFAFTPCGYSMNGMEGGALSTIHIAPEETHSYASFEAMGYNPQVVDLQALVNRVVSCFRPATFVMSVHVSGCGRGAEAAMSWGSAVLPLGYDCGSSDRQELPGDGVVTFHTFRKSCGHNWGVIPQPLFPLLSQRGSGRDDHLAIDACGMQRQNGGSFCCVPCSIEERSGTACGGIVKEAMDTSAMKLEMFLRDTLVSNKSELCDHLCDMDLRRLVRHGLTWSSALPRVRPFYELQCNSCCDHGFISVLAGLGAGFCVSGRAQLIASDAVRIPSDRIIYTGICELPSPISHSRNPLLTTVRSEMELFPLQRLYPNAALIVRFPSDDACRVCSLGSPTPHVETMAAIEHILVTAKKLNLRVVGVAMDFSSDRVLSYGDGVKVARKVFETARCTGHPPLKLLDLGDVLLFDVSERWLARASAINQAVEKYFPAATEVEVIAMAGRAPKAEGAPTRGATATAAEVRKENGREANMLFWEEEEAANECGCGGSGSSVDECGCGGNESSVASSVVTSEDEREMD